VRTRARSTARRSRSWQYRSNTRASLSWQDPASTMVLHTARPTAPRLAGGSWVRPHGAGRGGGRHALPGWPLHTVSSCSISTRPHLQGEANDVGHRASPQFSLAGSLLLWHSSRRSTWRCSATAAGRLLAESRGQPADQLPTAHHVEDEDRQGGEDDGRGGGGAGDAALGLARHRA